MTLSNEIVISWAVIGQASLFHFCVNKYKCPAAKYNYVTILSNHTPFFHVTVIMFFFSFYYSNGFYYFPFNPLMG